MSVILFAICAVIAIAWIGLHYAGRARRGRGRREAARIRMIWDKRRRDDAMHFE
jgi:hypothetical protein